MTDILNEPEKDHENLREVDSVVDSHGAGDSLEIKIKALEDLKIQRYRTNRWFLIFVILCGFLTLFPLYFFIIAFGSGNAKSYSKLAKIALGTAPYILFLLIGAVTHVARRGDLDNEIREIRFEIELSEHPIEPREVRAERLFRMNQYELRKYYNLNRNQNRLIVIVGIVCIFLGLGVVYITLNMVSGGLPPSSGPSTAPAFDVWIKGFVAFVGVVGTILVNYVAGVFLKMHAASATALGEFHNRLVGTNKLFLANVLASRIDDDTKRQDTLAELAKALTKT